jgi:NAD-dependent protein deacetylase/lipoamidase
VSRPANIVVLTGSGVSAESGIATFRDAGGVWAKYDYREVATPEGFAADPALVHSFYNQRRCAVAVAQPNAAHIALAELETGLKKRGGRLTIITQNVDDLHERAGSKSLFHMHGELTKATCTDCGGVLAWREDLALETQCPACDHIGTMRPFVVWFGETPRFMEEAVDVIMGADLFVSIGTSGAVYPAAGFVSEALAYGVSTMELNLEPSENAHLFTDSRYGPATKIVPDWVSEVLSDF